MAVEPHLLYLKIADIKYMSNRFLFLNNGVALSEADTPDANLTPRQNTQICNPPFYVAVTFEPITQS